MLIMGISGGPFRTYEDGSIIGRFAFHDSAAVLLKDGEVVAAIETERLNRIKHTNKFPVEAIRFCLDRGGVSLGDLDAVAYYGEEVGLDHAVEQWNLQRSVRGEHFCEFSGARALIQTLLAHDFGCEVPASVIHFVNHHIAHASSAFFPSGFEESLVVSFDAQGDNESGRVVLGRRTGLETIASFTVQQSLGGFYITIIKTLGFQQFEEYKVMGLAPYGDGSVFRDRFDRFYTLLPDGGYRLNWDEIAALPKFCRPRKRGEEIAQEHSDLAAALQEALENIVLHVLTYFREATGQKNLCLAGGVAHNCSLNGRILRSQIFENMFVQPAAHDAGCAYGAALAVHCQTTGRGVSRLGTLYWGSEPSGDEEIAAALAPWSRFLEWRKLDDVCEATAQLLAGDAVVGWIQGRSEFGPRALGNRSILADPRPAENKIRINDMVKKREAFRPFAPSVLEEEADEYFEVDRNDPNLRYMIFVVQVKPDKQSLLGAVTHVDGTARIQTVAKEDNPTYWKLICAFKELTGVPVLLNTSFNNDAEPIVESIGDAITCLLTTNIDYLIAGQFLVKKRSVGRDAWGECAPALPPHIVLSKTRRTGPGGSTLIAYDCRNNFDTTFVAPLSGPLFEALLRCDGRTPAADLLAAVPESSGAAENAYDELLALWARRLVVLRPEVATAAAHT